MEFKHKQLDNGLTIIGEVNPLAQSAAVGFFVRTGSRDETPVVNGVSHFLEHMLFKGTDALSALDVNEAFDRLGAKFNAFTSEENTVFYAAVLPEYLQPVSDLWMQLMRPSLRDDDFNMEKNVILEEIAMYKDLPQFDVMDRGKKPALRRPPLRQQCSGHQREYHRPFRPITCGTISLTGMHRTISFWRAAGISTLRISAGLRTKNAPAGHRLKRIATCLFLTAHSRKNQSKIPILSRQHLCLLSPAVSMQDRKRYAASLLSTIIGDSTGSRYYWALVDPALAETAAMQCESMDGAGVFYSYICCNPDNTEKILEIIEALFVDLENKAVSQDELDAARNKVLSAMTLQSEQPMGRLVNLGFNWVYNQEYCSVIQDVERIRSVTLADISRLIEQLRPGKFTQFSLGPKELP